MKMEVSFPVERVAGRPGDESQIVIQENHGVLTARCFVDTTREATNDSGEVRDTFRAVSQAFANLTTAQREAWQTWSENFEREEWFGKVATGAKGAFTVANMTNHFLNGSVNVDPPTQEPDVEITSIGHIYFNSGTGYYDIQINWTGTLSVGVFLVELTEGRTSPNWYPRESDYRMACGPFPGSFEGAAAQPETFHRQYAWPDKVNGAWHWVRVSYWAQARWPGHVLAWRRQMFVT